MLVLSFLRERKTKKWNSILAVTSTLRNFQQYCRKKSGKTPNGLMFKYATSEDYELEGVISRAILAPPPLPAAIQSATSRRIVLPRRPLLWLAAGQSFPLCSLHPDCWDDWESSHSGHTPVLGILASADCPLRWASSGLQAVQYSPVSFLGGVNGATSPQVVDYWL